MKKMNDGILVKDKKSTGTDFKKSGNQKMVAENVVVKGKKVHGKSNTLHMFFKNAEKK